MAAADIHDVAPGLWTWRTAHPDHAPGEGWDPLVTSTHVTSGGETVLLDPLAPAPADTSAWDRLQAAPPTAIVVLKPDHLRDAELFHRRWGAPVFGPATYYPSDVPKIAITPIEPGARLPGGLEALYDGRNRGETPLWLPEQRTLVFADGLTAPDGTLRVWGTPWHEQRVLPALRQILDDGHVPEHVIVSHGEPVHDGAEFARALDRPPYDG